MTALELKNTLIKEIENIENLDTLETLQIILTNLVSGTPVLTDWQLKRIEESKSQIKRGEFITREEADIKIEEWLKK